MEAWGFVSFFCLHMRLAYFNNEETIGWVVGAKKKKGGGGSYGNMRFPRQLKEKNEGWKRP